MNRFYFLVRTYLNYPLSKKMLLESTHNFGWCSKNVWVCATFSYNFHKINQSIQHLSLQNFDNSFLIFLFCGQKWNLIFQSPKYNFWFMYSNGKWFFYDPNVIWVIEKYRTMYFLKTYFLLDSYMIQIYYTNHWNISLVYANLVCQKYNRTIMTLFDEIFEAVQIYMIWSTK